MIQSGCGDAMAHLQILPAGSGPKPIGQLGCKSREVRSTLPAQGASEGHTFGTGPDKLGDSLEKSGRRKAQLCGVPSRDCR